MSTDHNPHRPFSYGALPHRRSLSATAYAAAIWLGLVVSVWAFSGETDSGQGMQVRLSEPAMVLSAISQVTPALALLCVD
jgi:hypothetical protein